MMPTKEHFDRLRSLSLRNFAGILRPGGSGGLNEGRLEAWGGDSNFFNQGAAKQSEDPDVVAASMAKPGVMLKRPVGSNGPSRRTRATEASFS
jgi:hypothetical protein